MRRFLFGLLPIFAFVSLMAGAEDELHAFRAVLGTVIPSFGSLPDEQLHRLVQANGHTFIDTNLLNFAATYDGGPENLATVLDTTIRWKTAVGEGHSEQVIAEWLAMPEMEAIAKYYKRIQDWGFSIELRLTRPLRSDGRPVDGLVTYGPNVRKVEVAVGLSDIPSPLIFAEEIIHAYDLALAEQKPEAPTKWIRNIIAENNQPDADTVSQMERYHFGYMNAIAQSAEKVDPALVSTVRDFMLELGAADEVLHIYNAWIQRQPAYRNKMLTEIAASPDPVKTFGRLYASPPGHFSTMPKGLADRIGSTTMRQILFANGIGLETSRPLAMQLPPVKAQPLPWTTAEEFLAIVPRFFKSELYKQARLYAHARPSAAGFSESDIESFGQYLLNPDLSQPFQVSQSLERRFGSSREEFRVSQHFEWICQILVSYDLNHGTHFTEQYGFKMLSQLNKDSGTRDNEHLFFYLFYYLDSPQATSAAARAFMNALFESRSAGGFLLDPNNGSRIQRLLELLGEDAAVEEVDALLMARAQYFSGLAMSNRGGSASLDLSYAESALEMGLKLMLARGNQTYARIYQARLADMKAQVEKTNAASFAAYEKRAPTPAGYKKEELTYAVASAILRARDERDMVLHNLLVPQRRKLSLGVSIGDACRAILQRGLRNPFIKKPLQ